MRIASTSVLYI